MADSSRASVRLGTAPPQETPHSQGDNDFVELGTVKEVTKGSYLGHWFDGGQGYWG